MCTFSFYGARPFPCSINIKGEPAFLHISHQAIPSFCLNGHCIPQKPSECLSYLHDAVITVNTTFRSRSLDGLTLLHLEPHRFCLHNTAPSRCRPDEPGWPTFASNINDGDRGPSHWSIGRHKIDKSKHYMLPHNCITY